MERGTRSESWFEAFILQALQVYIQALSGGVTLIFQKNGPSGGCNKFWNLIFPEIEANKDVSFITLIDIQNPLAPGILYWKKGDPPPNPPKGPADPNSGGGGPGGDGSGIVIPPLPPSNRDPNNDVWNSAATAFLLGDVTAAVLPGSLLPAATILKNGLSGLNAATSQGQVLPATSSDQWLGLGEQWPANIDSFGKQKLELPDASSPVEKSQDGVLSPRDEGSTCSLGLMGWEEVALPWVTSPDSAQPPRRANGGSTFHLSLSMPPVGEFVPMVESLLSKIPSLLRGTVLRVDVIQTRLPQTAEAGRYRLDVKVVNRDSNQVLARQSEAVDNGLEISVHSAELPTPMFAWWDGLDLLHFREGAAGQQ